MQELAINLPNNPRLRGMSHQHRHLGNAYIPRWGAVDIELKAPFASKSVDP